MTKLTEILQQPEGRRLEFKAALPTNAELAKTIISFANDAGCNTCENSFRHGVAT